MAIAITPDGKTVYVADDRKNLIHNAPGLVTPIATATNTAGKSIKVGLDPLAIAVTPDGKTVYVVCAGTETVIPIATATNTAGKPIKVGGSPTAIAFGPGSARD